MILSGTVKFRNTHGYLSAEKYPNIHYNTVFLVIFTFLCGIWTLGMYKYKERTVPIHYMVAIVLYACWFESMFNLIYYKNVNEQTPDYKNGHLGVPARDMLGMMSIITDVIRSVFSRVIVLLTALGQHITVPTVNGYYVNIGIISFIYAITLIIALAVENNKNNYIM